MQNRLATHSRMRARSAVTSPYSLPAASPGPPPFPVCPCKEAAFLPPTWVWAVSITSRFCPLPAVRALLAAAGSIPPPRQRRCPPPAVLLRREVLRAVRLGRERDRQSGGAAESPEPARARQPDGQAAVPLPGLRRGW